MKEIKDYPVLKNAQAIKDKGSVHLNEVLCPSGLYLVYDDEHDFSWTLTVGDDTWSGDQMESLYTKIKEIKKILQDIKVDNNIRHNALICYTYRLQEVSTFFNGHITCGDPKGAYETVVDNTLVLRDCTAIAPISCIDELREDFLKTDETDYSKCLAMFGSVAFKSFLVDDNTTHKVFKTSASQAKYLIKQSTPDYHESWMINRLPDQDVYHFIRHKCFRASICMNHDSRKVYENVRSFDQSSAHAHKLICKEFPISKPIELKKIPDDLDEYFEDHFCWMEIELKGISLLEEADELDPFKVRGRKDITLCVDQLQWKAFKMYYYYEDMTITRFISSKKGFLPEWLRCVIADMYIAKAKYPSKDAFRNMLKVVLNSGSYGVTVEQLYDYWLDENHTDYKKYSNSEWNNVWKKRLVPPQIGVTITSYVFLDELSIISKDAESFAYCDTDSVKYEDSDIINEAIFNRNEEADKEIKEFCMLYDYEYEYMKDLGKYQDEGTYQKLKAIAPKEYIYLKHNMYGATTAGYASHYNSKWETEEKRIPVALYEPLSKGLDPFKYFTRERHFVDYKNLWFPKEHKTAKAWFKLTVDENAKVINKLEKIYKK